MSTPPPPLNARYEKVYLQVVNNELSCPQYALLARSHWSNSTVRKPAIHNQPSKRQTPVDGCCVSILQQPPNHLAFTN